MSRSTGQVLNISLASSKGHPAQRHWSQRLAQRWLHLLRSCVVVQGAELTAMGSGAKKHQTLLS